ncbi:COMM domain-containing protein 9 [Lethenteron reissneri]|uniref:COMM domain-containing protein 9 n=1 Tax=Lethenteron reissneri TaxID=7753 RepID=UPI002AB773FE|nr:COMM domain-containing protein 9 [Lethenteron reissneri]
MAELTAEDAAALSLLLQAPSKEALRAVVSRALSPSAALRTGLKEEVMGALELASIEHAEQLVLALAALAKRAVFVCPVGPEEALRLLPEKLPAGLRTLLAKALLDNVPAWRSELISDQVSLPRLASMEWSVHVKAASDEVAHLAVPTCLLQLQLEGAEETGPLTVELGRETLHTLLDTLGRIRTQLSAVAQP